jgi:hypothetical protein
MTDQMPLEGFEDHTHHHPQPVQMPQPAPPPTEAIQAGAQTWLAREFVGGLIAMAQTHEVDVADFLAEKCMILSLRAANGESEVEVLRAQLQALATENNELHRRLEECHCHDDESVTVIQVDGNTGHPHPSGPNTSNGATST